MSEVLKEGLQPLAAPVPVLVAGIAIVATRCLGLALQAHELGMQEVINFVHLTAQTWGATLIFIASQLLFFIELRCAIALMRGRNWGRWGFGLAQLAVMVYLLIVSAGWGMPSILGTAEGQTLPHLLLTQKLPDLLVVLLLFVPASSREFFRQG